MKQVRAMSTAGNHLRAKNKKKAKKKAQANKNHNKAVRNKQALEGQIVTHNEQIEKASVIETAKSAAETPEQVVAKPKRKKKRKVSNHHNSTTKESPIGQQDKVSSFIDKKEILSPEDIEITVGQGAKGPYIVQVVRAVQEHGQESVENFGGLRKITEMLDIKSFKLSWMTEEQEKFGSKLLLEHQAEYKRNIAAMNFMTELKKHLNINQKAVEKKVNHLEKELQDLIYPYKDSQALETEELVQYLSGATLDYIETKKELESQLNAYSIKDGYYNLKVGMVECWFRVVNERVQILSPDEVKKLSNVEFENLTLGGSKEEVRAKKQELEIAKKELKEIKSIRTDLSQYKNQEYLQAISDMWGRLLDKEYKSRNIEEIGKSKAALRNVEEVAHNMAQIVSNLEKILPRTMDVNIFQKVGRFEVMNLDNKNIKLDEFATKSIEFTRGQVMTLLLSSIPYEDLKEKFATIESLSTKGSSTITRTELFQAEVKSICDKVIYQHVNAGNISKDVKAADDIIKAISNKKVCVRINNSAAVTAENRKEIKAKDAKYEQANLPTFKEQAQSLSKDSAILEARRKVEDAKQIYKSASKSLSGISNWKKLKALLADNFEVIRKNSSPQTLSLLKNMKKVDECRVAAKLADKRLSYIEKSLSTACTMRDLKVSKSLTRILKEKLQTAFDKKFPPKKQRSIPGKKYGKTIGS